MSFNLECGSAVKRCTKRTQTTFISPLSNRETVKNIRMYDERVVKISQSIQTAM